MPSCFVHGGRRGGRVYTRVRGQRDLSPSHPRPRPRRILNSTAEPIVSAILHPATSSILVRVDCPSRDMLSGTHLSPSGGALLQSCPVPAGRLAVPSRVLPAGTRCTNTETAHLLSGHLGNCSNRYEVVLIVARERVSLVEGVAVVNHFVPRSLGVLQQWRNGRAVVTRG